MSATSPDRWQHAVTAANSQTLPERWQSLTQQWAAAVNEYRELYHAAAPDVARLRRVTRRVHDLEQQRQVMRHALSP
jgi:hypothetical protein